MGPWKTYYYKTLFHPHTDCLRNAKELCKALSLPPPTREPTFKQEHADCGFCSLFHIEEEARRQLGEPAWSLPYSVTQRVKLVRNMRDRLIETGGVEVADS